MTEDTSHTTNEEYLDPDEVPEDAMILLCGRVVANDEDGSVIGRIDPEKTNAEDLLE